jgi:hypothetical protein
VLRKAGVHSTLAALARAREVGYLPGSPVDRVAPGAIRSEGPA